jgi:hypothetical protein
LNRKGAASASKLVLLYAVAILGVAALFAIIWGIVHGTLDPKEIVASLGRR